MLLDDNRTARLADFGFASAFGATPELMVYLQTTPREPGAIRWAAPEHFSVRNIGRTTKSDIYSLGNLIFMASPPFISRMSASSFSRYCQENHHGQKCSRIMW